MFVLRKIRNGGRVKIKGKWYYPNEHFMKYDGRLDGLRMVFGVYEWRGEWRVDLWGTEEEHNSNDPDRTDFVEPHCVDGGYPWFIWEQKE